jgi:hypothetical protein
MPKPSPQLVIFSPNPPADFAKNQTTDGTDNTDKEKSRFSFIRAIRG